MHADDLALLAPMRSSVLTLLDVCHKYGMDWCITYNPSNIKLKTFGKPVDFQPLYLNGSKAPVSEYKYLGVHVVAGKDYFIKKAVVFFYL